jgi:putative transposase
MEIERQAINIERVEKDWLFLSISKLKGWSKVPRINPVII